MPNNQYKILITKPCTKNWDAMQPTEIGRHCNSCKKDVVDFSVLSDDEVKNYLIKNIGKETCGRFYHHQIDRIKIVLPQHILYSKIARWKKFLVVFMICFGVELFSIDVSLAQTQQSIDSLPGLDSIIQGDTLRILDSIKTVDTIKQDTLHLSTDSFSNTSVGGAFVYDSTINTTCLSPTMGVVGTPVDKTIDEIVWTTVSGNFMPIPVETRLGIIGPPNVQTLDTSSPLNPPKNTTPKKPKIPNKNLPLNNPPFLPEEIFTLNKRKKSK